MISCLSVWSGYKFEWGEIWITILSFGWFFTWLFVKIMPSMSVTETHGGSASSKFIAKTYRLQVFLYKRVTIIKNFAEFGLAFQYLVRFLWFGFIISSKPLKIFLDTSYFGESRVKPALVFVSTEKPMPKKQMMVAYHSAIGTQKHHHLKRNNRIRKKRNNRFIRYWQNPI